MLIMWIVESWFLDKIYGYYGIMHVREISSRLQMNFDTVHISLK